jgi:hypothetical protein
VVRLPFRPECRCSRHIILLTSDPGQDIIILPVALKYARGSVELIRARAGDRIHGRAPGQARRSPPERGTACHLVWGTRKREIGAKLIKFTSSGRGLRFGLAGLD